MKQALIDMGRTQIDFANGGTQYPVKVEDLPDETLLRIFDYGKRMFNDYVNSAKHSGTDAEEAAKVWLEKAKKGELGTRQAGARLDDMGKALRDIVKEYLRAAGWDAKEATKDCKEPEKAFKAMLALQIARGKGIPANKVAPEDVETAFEKNWPKLEAKAAAIVKAMGKGLDLDLD